MPLSLCLILLFSAPFAATQAPPPCYCGQANLTAEGRIVGGSEAGVDELPWQCYLRKKNVRYPFCGCSLITLKHAVTAAHCLKKENETLSLGPKDFQVVLGDHDWTVRRNRKRLVKDVDSIKIHHSYSPTKHTYDVAVIKMEISVTQRRFPHIRPACFPSYMPTENEKMIQSGWGVMKHEGVKIYPYKLQKVEVEVIEFAFCKKMNQPCLPVRRTNFCTGARWGGIGPCQGDSGGPVVFNNNGNYELTGVTSWGINCGGLPAVNTNLMEDSINQWLFKEVGYYLHRCPREGEN